MGPLWGMEKRWKTQEVRGISSHHFRLFKVAPGFPINNEKSAIFCLLPFFWLHTPLEKPSEKMEKIEKD